jgi:hypothetical protein
MSPENDLNDPTPQGPTTTTIADQQPAQPIPEESLRILYEAACQDTSGGLAARSFLFWLVGERDPSGFRGRGALELRRFDRKLRLSAMEVFTWWVWPTKSDQPLNDLVGRLAIRFASPPPEMDSNR